MTDRAVTFAVHATLTANIEDVVTLPVLPGHDRFELVNRDGNAEIFYTWTGDPATVEGDDTRLVTAIPGSARTHPVSLATATGPDENGTGHYTIRLVAAAGCRYSLSQITR